MQRRYASREAALKAAKSMQKRGFKTRVVKAPGKKRIHIVYFT